MKKFLLLWFVAASLIALLLYPLNMPRLSPLATKGIQTCGTVTAFEPNNHQEIHYFFVANGKTYSGSQQGGTGDQRNAFTCAAGSSGIVVYYLPETPEISCAGNPRSLWENEVISIGLATVILPLFALLGTRWRYPRFRRWLAQLNKQPSKERCQLSDPEVICHVIGEISPFHSLTPVVSVIA